MTKETGIWSMNGPSETYEIDQAKREFWFSKIKPVGNWKEEIIAIILKEEFENCNQAAIWFCGCELTIAKQTDTHYVVTAPGYYRTIGS